MIEIDIPEVYSELIATFEDYERALIANDIAAVNKFFWDNSLTIRYGTSDGECHYGYADIAAFRLQRGPVNQNRALINQRVTTFGRNYGITNTEYQPAASKK